MQVNVHTPGVFINFDDTLCFQVVCEFLFNIIKHSGTSWAAIDMEKVNDNIQIQIMISDSERGLQIDELLDQKHATGGLMNIRHRLNLIGFDSQFASQLKKGIQVIIQVPAIQVHI